ncbi:MAG TPA: hypothetical protein VNN99_04560 [Vicinamibacterales bacterium]|jgi:hypothetical protein|nr:hypothetical protein [Vicinamibacterales bacterium]
MQAVESKTSRRRFVGSALTLGAGTAIGATMSFPGAAVMATPGRGPDLVHDELVRQMKHGVRALRGPRGGEAAKRLAATTRVLAAHQQAGGDAELRRRLQAAVRRDGREAVLRAEANPRMLAAEAREFGFDLPPIAEPFDRKARERALDTMLKQGASPALLAAADALERLAPALERGGVTTVAARDAEACPNLNAQLLFLEFVAITSCFWNPIACAGFQGAYWGLKLSIYLAGC